MKVNLKPGHEYKLSTSMGLPNDLNALGHSLDILK